MGQGERTALTVVAAAVTAALLLGGCSGPGEDPKPTPTSSGGQSVVETTTPTPTPIATRPEMPAGAKKADVEGAADFVRYYVAATNYGYQTGDTKLLSDISVKECAACRGIEELIVDGHRDGRRIQGGLLKIGEVTPTPGDIKEGLDVAAFISQDAGQILGEGGSVIEQLPPEDKTRFTFLVKYQGDAWWMVEWGVLDPDA